MVLLLDFLNRQLWAEISTNNRPFQKILKRSRLVIIDCVASSFCSQTLTWQEAHAQEFGRLFVCALSPFPPKEDTGWEGEAEKGGRVLWGDYYVGWRGREVPYCLLGGGLLRKWVVATPRSSHNDVAPAEPSLAHPRPAKLPYAVHKDPRQMLTVSKSHFTTSEDSPKCL